MEMNPNVGWSMISFVEYRPHHLRHGPIYPTLPPSPAFVTLPGCNACPQIIFYPEQKAWQTIAANLSSTALTDCTLGPITVSKQDIISESSRLRP